MNKKRLLLLSGLSILTLTLTACGKNIDKDQIEKNLKQVNNKIQTQVENIGKKLDIEKIKKTTQVLVNEKEKIIEQVKNICNQGNKSACKKAIDGVKDKLKKDVYDKLKQMYLNK